MSNPVSVDDLELAALISSKICHDVIGPVGAIYNGLEVLDEDSDEDSRAYALDVIRSFTEQASAKLQFARFAFGAAGSAGAVIDLSNAEAITRGFIGTSKQRLSWQVPPGHMAKDYVKLLLNMVAVAQTALPHGGEIAVSLKGRLERPELHVHCSGPKARLPAHLPDFLSGARKNGLDPLSIQPYYTCRLAETAKMHLSVAMSGADVVLLASPID
ncbi:MAG: histidine phosphotransferase family protein [Hyphomicrobiaceae bacterium]